MHRCYKGYMSTYRSLSLGLLITTLTLLHAQDETPVSHEQIEAELKSAEEAAKWH